MASDDSDVDLGDEGSASHSDQEPAEKSDHEDTPHSSKEQSQHSLSHHSGSEVDMGSDKAKEEASAHSDEEELDMGSSDHQGDNAEPAGSEDQLDMGSSNHEEPDKGSPEKKEEEVDMGYEEPKIEPKIEAEEQKAEEAPQQTSEVEVTASAEPLQAQVESPKAPVRPSHPAYTGSIPLLVPESVNRDTYDMDYLLDPRTQKQLASSHRFMSQLPSSLTKPRSVSPPASRNFVQDHIARMSNTKSSMRVSLDNEQMYAGLLLFSPPKEPRKEPVDVKHFYEFRTRAEVKTDRLRKEMSEKEVAECSFKPTIIGPAQPRQSRSSQEYYTDMIQYKAKTNAKLRQMKDETDKMMKETEGQLFKPALCEKSRKMAGDSTQPRYEMLYQLHKGRLQSQIQGPEDLLDKESQDSLASEQSSELQAKPFHPAINKRSHHMTRDAPVEEYLYQEAFKRAEKQRNAQPKPREAEKLISSSSETLLVEKFQAELDEQWKVLEGEKEDISYMKFVELLLNLSFVDNNPEVRTYEQERDLVLRAWNSFGVAADQRVMKRRVELLLNSVMNFWTPGMAAPEVPPPALSEDNPATIPETAEDKPAEAVGFYTTPAKVSKVHSQFRPLYEHRMWKLGKSNIHPTFKFKEELPFRPTLDRGSEKMAEETRQHRGEKIEDVLMAETQRIKERQDQQKAKVDRDTLKECRFRPETNRKSAKLIGTVEAYTKDSLSSEYIKIRNSEQGRNETLYQLAAVAQERKKKAEKTPEDVADEGNMVECTFAPNLAATRESVIKVSKEDHKGIDKAVERMKKAREDAQRVKLMTERGFAHNGEIEPVRFTIDHKHKLIPKFDPSKAPEKKVGKPGMRSAPLVPKSKPSPPRPAQPTETQGSGPGYSEIRETSSEEVKSEEPEPVFTIAVALSETEKDSINYYAGDKVEDLARKFVEKHGLAESDVERLTNLINSKMQEQESS